LLYIKNKGLAFTLKDTPTASQQGFLPTLTGGKRLFVT